MYFNNVLKMLTIRNNRIDCQVCLNAFNERFFFVEKILLQKKKIVSIYRLSCLFFIF